MLRSSSVRATHADPITCDQTEVRIYENPRGREHGSAELRQHEDPDDRDSGSSLAAQSKSFVVSQRDPPDADIGVSTDPERRDV